MDLEKLNELSVKSICVTTSERKHISITGKILLGLTGNRILYRIHQTHIN